MRQLNAVLEKELPLVPESVTAELLQRAIKKVIDDFTDIKDNKKTVFDSIVAWFKALEIKSIESTDPKETETALLKPTQVTPSGPVSPSLAQVPMPSLPI